jgi:hsp70-interacting protein
MEYYKSKSEGEGDDSDDEPPLSLDSLEDLMQELRDIVEQVDYARAFVSLKGLNYLLGAITAAESGVPEVIRNMCLLVLATLSQNNPPVQKELLEMGAIKTLSDLFLEESTTLMTKTRIMQAMSSMIRNLDITEGVFEQLPQAPLLMVEGLNPNPVLTNESLRTKTLFFLRAFLTSDTATADRANKFGDAIAMVADPQYLDDGSNAQLRESAIAMLNSLLERQMAVNILLQRKDMLASLGVQRISQIRSLTGEEAELVHSELESWETFIVLLARAKPEDEA